MSHSLSASAAEACVDARSSSCFDMLGLGSKPAFDLSWVSRHRRCFFSALGPLFAAIAPIPDDLVEVLE